MKRAPDPKNVRDALLTAGYSDAEVEDMLRAKLLREAFNATRPLCVECGDPASRYFETEGDGPFWLCDRVDEDHGPTRYLGELKPHASDAIRELEETTSPLVCQACDLETLAECGLCGGFGWVVEEEP